MRIPSGKTDIYLYFVAYDSADHTTRKTGLSGFTVYRSRNGAAEVAYTTPTVTEIDSTNMPGVYALLVDEDTTIASTSDSEEYTVHITVSGMDPVTRSVELYRRDTTSGMTLDVSSGGEAGLDWANIGSPTTTVGLSGTTVKTATDVETDTADIQSRLPAALVSGRIDASVGAMASAVLTATAIASDAITAAKIADGAIDAATFAAGAIDAAAIATDAITAAKIAADAIGASELASDAVTEIQSGLSTLDAAGVRAAVGLASANLDTQLDALPTAIEVATEVWGTNLSTDGTASEIIITNLDAPVSSRFSIGDYTAPDNASVTAIKAKTDSLTYTVAGQIDANIQSVNDVTVTGTGASGNEWGP